MLVSRSVRGLETEYPQGDTPLRWQSPPAETHTIQPGETARVDVAFIWTSDPKRIGFLKPIDETVYSLGTFAEELDSITGQIAIHDLDRHERDDLNFTISTGRRHPVGIEVARR